MNNNPERIMKILKKWKEWWLTDQGNADMEVSLVIYAFHKMKAKSCTHEFYCLRLFCLCREEKDSAQLFFSRMNMQDSLPSFYKAYAMFLIILHHILIKNTKVLI